MVVDKVVEAPQSVDVDRETFTCPICLDRCPVNHVFVPSGCNHQFCRECARGVVLSAVRNLDFPIDCPVCKLDTAESGDEEETSPEPAVDQLQTLTPTDRTRSENVMSQLSFDAVDPDHALQLHACHSTPSLDTVTLPDDGPNNMAGKPLDISGNHRQLGSCQTFATSANDQQDSNSSKVLNSSGSNLKPLASGIDILAATAELSFVPVHSVATAELDESRSNQHHVSSPRFPVMVTGTPTTPSLVPTEPLTHQGSRSLFSPHELPQASESLSDKLGTPQAPALRLSRASLSASREDLVATQKQAEADLAGKESALPEHLSQRSISMGGVMTAPRGVNTGLSSPADWMAAVAEPSSGSPPLSRGGSRGGPQGGHSRRGSLDADVHKLLTHEEEEEYLSKSLKAAAHRYGSLVQCPKPDCEGVASLQEEDPHFECPQCGYEWCRECQRDWHPFTRCQDATGEKCVSRYIPKKPKKKKGHRRDGGSCLSMGSMGDLIKVTMKKKFGSMDIADSEASLNRYLKRNRVLECPQCKNGITKMDGGCNHIMCAVCKTHICWLCGVKICQGINNYWDANRHFWIKGTPCYGQIQAVL